MWFQGRHFGLAQHHAVGQRIHQQFYQQCQHQNDDASHTDIPGEELKNGVHDPAVDRSEDAGAEWDNVLQGRTHRPQAVELIGTGIKRHARIAALERHQGGSSQQFQVRIGIGEHHGFAHKFPECKTISHEGRIKELVGMCKPLHGFLAQAFYVVAAAVAVVGRGIGLFEIHRRHSALIGLVFFQFIQVIYPVEPQLLLGQYILQTISTYLVVDGIVISPQGVTLFEVAPLACIRTKRNHVAIFGSREIQVAAQHLPGGCSHHWQFVFEAVFTVFEQSHGIFGLLTCRIGADLFKFLQKHLFDIPAFGTESHLDEIIFEGFKLLPTHTGSGKSAKFGVGHHLVG